MSSKKLTVKTLQNIKPPEAGRMELWDSVIGDDHSLPGTLGLRVTPNGAMTWQIMYRITLADGRRTQRRLAIGKYPSLSLSAARTLARDELMRAGRNEDPRAARTSAQEAASKILRVDDAVDQFIERYAKRQNRGWKETRRVFDKYVLPSIGERKLDEIGRRDIVAILDGLLEAGHPYMANRVLATVRRFFNWCLQ